MSQPAEKLDLEALSLSAAAREALEQGDGYPDKAADILKRWALSNNALYRTLMDPLLDGAVWNAVNTARRQQNREFRTTAKVGKDNTAGLSAVAQQNAKDWLDGYRLRNGVKLGDATKAELSEEIEWHDTLAKSNAERARWYRRIVERIGDKPVRDALTNDQVEQLFEETRHA